LNIRKHQEQVIHCDLDGILSGLFVYNELDLEVAGFIDYKRNELIISSTPLNHCWITSNFVFNDCAMGECDSYDHHFQTPSLTNKLNVHNHFKITNFKNKMPFGNCVWLIWLFGKDIRNYTHKQLQFIFGADSFYHFCDNKRYRENIKEWDCRLNFNFDSINFTKSIKPSEWKEFHNEWLKYDLIYKNNEFVWGNTSAQDKINELAEIFNLKAFKLPKIDYKYPLKSYDYNINNLPVNPFTITQLHEFTGRYSDLGQVVCL
jgi:hypothetical protein